MALEQHTLDRLLKLRPSRLLCLGYPDLLITDGPKIEADDVAKWHGWTAGVGDTDKVLRDAGINPVYIDVQALRGRERVVDLNDPLPIDMIGQFDCVLDPGTIEHCFNIGQAFQNVLSALRLGGYAIHTNPMTMVNHGFWNLSPTAYVDWYEANGGEIREIAVVSGNLGQRVVTDIGVHALNRVQLPPECSSLVIAQRVKGVKADWPIQTKYRRVYAQAG